jgi:SAM-dependent methyltransferase
LDTETEVANHYTHGALEAAILDALRRAGRDIDRLAPSDLGGIDEFHMGGHPATEALARDLALAPDMDLLDVGSGIGGPARFFAAAYGCRVTGIDLTQEFVEVATALSARCGLQGKTTFRQGSALALPFAAGTFDRATLIHVGMNIEDKATLFAEVRRVLKSDGLFGVYELMRLGDFPYPMPWALTPATSFVETPETYRRLLAAADFTIEHEADRTALALDVVRQGREEAARGDPTVLNRQAISTPEAAVRFRNVAEALQAGLLAPVQILARAA